MRELIFIILFFEIRLAAALGCGYTLDGLIGESEVGEGLTTETSPFGTLMVLIVDYASTPLPL